MRSLLIFITLLFNFHNSFAFDKDFIVGDWKFIYGDDESFPDVGIDESNWQNITMGKSLPSNTDFAISGWYRVSFDAHVDISEQYALIIENLRLADETWINGVKVGGIGQFNKNWQFEKNSPLGLIRKYDLPAGFLKYHDNLLAIKVTTGFGKAKGAVLPVGIGIGSDRIFLSELRFADKYYNQQVTLTSSIDSAFLTMGLIELLILLLLIRTALVNSYDFKWLFFSSLTLFIGGVGHDSFFIFDVMFSQQYLSTSLVFAFILLIAPLSLLLYFWSQFKDYSTKTMLLISLVYITFCFLILLPIINNELKVVCWYAWSAMTFTFIIYCFTIAFRAIILKRTGSIAQLIGFSILIVSALLHHFSDGFWGHRNIQFGSLFYRYAILFAYFQRIKAIRLDFKKLSTRMVNIVEEINAKFARELHDGLGQNLASIKLHLKLLGNKTKGSSSNHVDIISSELEKSTNDLRDLINGLHPAIIDNYTIVESLEKECNRLNTIYPSIIHFNSDEFTNTINLSNTIKLHIFRIFQECVNNAIKHGKAKNIKVVFLQNKSAITLNIIDDGCGYDEDKKTTLSVSGGLGFISLHERVALLDGRVDFGSVENKGSIVSVYLPLNQL